MTNPSDMSNEELADALEKECRHLEQNPRSLCSPSYYASEAASRLRAMEWQPIETADHEATEAEPIDVWVSAGDGYRCPNSRFWSWASNGQCIYINAENKLVIPSHWMRRPSGPAPKGE